MSERTTRKLPMTATFVGGPVDGQRFRRRTNRFSQFRRDDGRVLGYKGQVRHWHTRMEQGLQPTSGYVQCPNVNSRGELVEEFWHYSRFFELQEERDRWLYKNDDNPDRDLIERIDEWDAIREMRSKHPEAFAKAVEQWSPHMAEFLFGVLEMALDEGTLDPDGRPVAEIIAEDLGIDLADVKPATKHVPEGQSAGQARKLKVVQERAPELAADVESGKRSVADAYQELIERDRADQAAR